MLVNVETSLLPFTCML